MAADVKKIIGGAPTVSIAAWVTGGTGHSFADLGITGDVEITDKIDRAEIGEGEQILGPQRAIPNKFGVEVKFQIKEGDLPKLQKFLAQPTANLTGTAPNQTLLVGDPQEQYYALQVVATGEAGTAGTYSVRTYTFYRGYFEIGGKKHSKSEGYVYDVTMKLLYDSTVSTADKWYKMVQTAGA